MTDDQRAAYLRREILHLLRPYGSAVPGLDLVPEMLWPAMLKEHADPYAWIKAEGFARELAGLVQSEEENGV